MELSQCGPAPLKAIKNGEVYIGYDTGFIFSEVNADKVSWIVKRVGRTELIHGMGKRDVRSVGVNISTKAVGSSRLQLITNEYKHAEHSEEERESWKKAYSFGARPDYFDQFFNVEEEGDTKISIRTEPQQPVDGKDFAIVVAVRNELLRPVCANVTSELHTMYYTGARRHFVKGSSKEDEDIPAQSTREFRINVSPANYKGKRADGHMGMKCGTVVAIGEKIVCDSFQFQLVPPSVMSVKVNTMF